MSEEEIKRIRENYILAYRSNYDSARELHNKVFDELERLQQENTQLKKQLEYLRSGEYLNQLKFERNLLEDIVQNGEVSKEDKEFIDMTHRNTELLEENQQLKSVLKEIREYIENNTYSSACTMKTTLHLQNDELYELLEIIDKAGIGEDNG